MSEAQQNEAVAPLMQQAMAHHEETHGKLDELLSLARQNGVTANPGRQQLPKRSRGKTIKKSDLVTLASEPQEKRFIVDQVGTAVRPFYQVYEYVDGVPQGKLKAVEFEDLKKLAEPAVPADASKATAA